MKTLKRTLALVLVLVLSLSFFAISASADFKDADKINYKNEVSILVGLGIIEGFEDGTFQATGNVTKAQMAKLIAYAMIGAEDAEKLTAAVAPFPDVETTHWAAGYILFCKNLGIIIGDDTGKYNPSENLTGYQTAKMLLVLVGYGQNDEYVGISWSANASRKALDIDLFKDNLGGLSDKAVSREEACLYLWNALNVQMVTYDGDGKYTGLTYKDSSNDAQWQTLGYKNYDIATATGMVTANSATDKNYRADTDKSIKAKTSIGGTDYTVDTGLDLFGHTVKVYYKENDETKVYAVEDKTKVFATLSIGSKGDDKDARVTALRSAGFTVTGGSENADVSVRLSTDYGSFNSTVTLDSITERDSYIFLSDSSDKVPQYAIKLTEAIYKIEKMNDSNSLVTLKSATGGTTSVAYADVSTGVDSLAVDDIVVGSRVNDAYWSLKVAEKVTGAVSAVKVASARTYPIKDEVTVGGKVYKPFNGVQATDSIIDNASDVNEINDKDYINKEKSTTLYLDSAGNYMAIVANDDSSRSDVVVVFEGVNRINTTSSSSVLASYVRAIKTDGTEVLYMTNSKTNNDYSDYPANTDINGNVEPELMGVTVNSSDVATLYLLSATAKAVGNNSYCMEDIAVNTELKTTTTNVKTATTNHTVYISSSTPIVFMTPDDDEDVYELDAVKSNIAYDIGTVTAQVLYKVDSSGNFIAQMILILDSYSDSGVSSDSLIYFKAGTSAGTYDATGWVYEGYNCATGVKTNFKIKSIKNNGGNNDAGTSTLSGFYKYSLDDAGYYTANGNLGNDIYTVTGDRLDNFYSGSSVMTTTAGITDCSYKNATVMDVRSAADKREADGFYKYTISSVGDIDSAKAAGYDVLFDIVYNDDDDVVLSIAVTSAKSSGAAVIRDGTYVTAIGSGTGTAVDPIMVTVAATVGTTNPVTTTTANIKVSAGAAIQNYSDADSSGTINTDDTFQVKALDGTVVYYKVV